MIPFLILVGAGVGLALWAAMKDDENPRSMWLINGKRYAIVHRITGPGWAATMYPGFCNFSEPVITGQNTNARGQAWTEVQFTANWCAANTQFVVPESMAISEV